MKEISIACLGYEIKANWYDNDSDIIMLVLPGYTSKKAKYEEMISYVTEKTGISALVIDYSGHGESPFQIEKISPAQNFLEVIEAYDWIKNKFPNHKIIVHGTSYGGFLATQLTKYREFDELILRVPAIFEPSNFYTKWGDYNVEKGRKYRVHGDFNDHPLLKRASMFEGRSLVVTHELDEVCPPNSTDAFIKSFSADHIEFKGIKHGFGESNMSDEQKTEYYQNLVDWLVK